MEEVSSCAAAISGNQAAVCSHPDDSKDEGVLRAGAPESLEQIVPRSAFE
jgi:hypothetical protein